MKNVVIIGAAGFVGKHLIKCINENYKVWDIAATKLPDESIDIDGIKVIDLDITDYNAVKELLLSTKPDYIFHLAAQSSVAQAWKNPEMTIDINIIGALHVLEAAKEMKHKPKILLVGSSEEYGTIDINKLPISEEHKTTPENIYAVTKVCQNMVGRLYAKAYSMDIMSTRSFNHTGPDQSTKAVVADFCKQVVDIERGLQQPVIKVGKLDIQRDFTDVRDVVRAYIDIILKGHAGETYNVGSGKMYSIREILNTILSMSDVKIDIIQDDSKIRPLDVLAIEANIDKLKKETGWEPNINMEQTICDTLEWYRKK